ncbi:MAG: hypothetical protein RIG82_00030 [Phycisphaeraceae bacterium]
MQFRAQRSMILLAAALLCPAGITQAAESQWAYPGPDGRLLYHTQPNGDRLPDHSAVGYLSNREPLPSIPTSVTVQPGAGDDTARIQAAIDQVAALPIGPDGYRGAVQLGPGEFQINNSVWITDSGIVLRGSGQQTTGGTILRATGTTQRDVIMVQGSGSWSRIASSEKPVIDKYVPVGATSFRVADASTFAVGDRVIVHRPSTQNWIEELGMDQIPPRSDGGTVVQWTAGAYDRNHDRVVTRVEGDRIFFDAPLTQSLDAEYGGGTVYKYNWSGRISHVGVENLRGVSDYDTNNNQDEAHARSLIFMDRIEHAFVQSVTAEHFWYSLIEADRFSKNITVKDATNLDPISIVTGGRRYAFQNNSQLSLFRDLLSDKGRHDFIQNSPNTGPNVFLDGVATNALDETGPHQRWSTGGLYDNITVEGDEINFRNRGNFGTGHGWAGGNMIAWNSTAEGFIIQNPPTAQNWLIGGTGQLRTHTAFGVQEPGIIDHHGSPVDTRSLYEAQLADRDRFPDSSFREYHLGDYDTFYVDGLGSRDAAPVDPNWASEVTNLANLSGQTVGDFDNTTLPGLVPFTFDFLIEPGERVVGATLTLALRSITTGPNQDFLALERTDNAMSLASLGLTTITTTGSDILVVPLTGAMLSELQDGQLNGVVGDGLAIDWSRLDLVVVDALFGDLNLDSVVNETDIDLLGFAIRAGSTDKLYELDGVPGIDQGDITALLDIIGTAPGDANLDLKVDLIDLSILASNFQSLGGWAKGDANVDGTVNLVDLSFLASNFGFDATAIPEPYAIALIALGLTRFSLRR